MNPNLTFLPQDGRVLRVVAVCRVSSEKQDERSVDDQLSLVKTFVKSRYSEKADYVPIQSQAKGELLDRPELRRLEDLVASKRFDMVVVEDAGRIARRSAYLLSFCELCLDHGVRLIAINDNLDTDRPDWRMNVLFTGFRHEMYNQDTSDRIRRAYRGRFPNGDLLCALPYGFIKPDGAKSDILVKKDPVAEPIVEEIFRRVEAGGSFAEIAAWLTEQQVPVGPSVREGKWTAGLVGRLVRNTVYKGVRQLNRRVVKRVHGSGRRRAVKGDPAEILTRECPHWVFIDPARFDRLQRMLQQRNGKFSRAKNGADPRANVPKKSTYWPGGHAVCGVCGSPLYWGGHGRMDRLLCSGCRRHTCWNSCTFDGAFGATAILQAVLKVAAELPEFDDELTARVRRELDEQSAGLGRRRAQLDHEVEALERKIANLGKAIAAGTDFEVFREPLQALNSELHRVKDERVLMDQQPDAVPPLPSRNELRRLAEEALRDPPLKDPEFQRMMKALLPRLHLVPYRLCTDNKVVPRAKILIDFLALSPDHQSLNGGVASYQKEVVVDLFRPSQHVRIREDVVRLRGEGKSERETAAILGVAVQTAQRAAAIQRTMDEQGLTDPWIELKHAPDDVGKMRSHGNKLYNFKPLDGFQPAV